MLLSLCHMTRWIISADQTSASPLCHGLGASIMIQEGSDPCSFLGSADRPRGFDNSAHSPSAVPTAEARCLSPVCRAERHDDAVVRPIWSGVESAARRDGCLQRCRSPCLELRGSVFNHKSATHRTLAWCRDAEPRHRPAPSWRTVLPRCDPMSIFSTTRRFTGRCPRERSNVGMATSSPPARLAAGESHAASA